MSLWNKVFGGASKPTPIAPSTPESTPLAVPSQEPTECEVSINAKDGAEMVYVPAGPFLMGDDYQLDNPRRTVTLSGYWIYKNDVTVAQYREFCEASGRQMPSAPSWGWKDDHPVVNVTWNDAKAYCDWAEVSLPTEAQWEKAARGTDGRKYPWGNDWDPAKCVNSTGSTKPVGSIPAGASPYGCLDMAGNVFQWCADWYNSGYCKKGENLDPLGPATGASRILRGGSWLFVFPDGFRCASRDCGNAVRRRSYLGFRGARTVQQ